ncbi:MAG: hypothetical protein ACKVP7_00460 [Hyphomicrobiaceae bacterium]
MPASERDEIVRQAKAAGLTKLSETHLAEFARTAKTAAELAKRLPKDLGGTDEMALVLRLTPRTGDRS